MKVVTLSEEDRKELVQMYDDMLRTPVIGLSVMDMVKGNDFASQAQARVRAKMDELGAKYGFDPRKMTGINKQTGEIHL